MNTFVWNTASPEQRRAYVIARVRRERKAQGLPRHITDTSVLARVASGYTTPTAQEAAA